MKSTRYYLLFYNATAFVFWLLYFGGFIANKFALNNQLLPLLNIAQGLALLEIVHAAFKLVKSPVVSTAVQVTSRLFILVLINIFFYRQGLNSIALYGVVIVSFAWSITELVRYAFYFTGLTGSTPGWLTWMRYTFFIVLYPTGVTGEAFIFLSPLINGGLGLNAFTIFAALVTVAYIYYFPVLYKYMWKQRRARV